MSLCPELYSLKDVYILYFIKGGGTILCHIVLFIVHQETISYKLVTEEETVMSLCTVLYSVKDSTSGGGGVII